MRIAFLFVVGLLSAVAVGAGLLLGGAMSDPAGAEHAMNRTSSTPAPVYSASGYDITPLTQAEVETLAKTLDPAEARVILHRGTEPAFCGDLVDNKRDGVYVCRLCGLPLFSSGAKFTSASGWPSFFQPIDSDHVKERLDRSFAMVRTELTCARCGAHLGHVFDDGPQPTGLRFCLNSASLTFVGANEETPPRSRPVATETAYFAGGCFWGIEDRFDNTPGVLDAVSGYQGGTTVNPTYQEVCTNKTGHAETVRVVFDPARVSYRDLLERFFAMHNPTELNRQGPDFGTQYRSEIFTASDEQQQAAEVFLADLQHSDRFAHKKIVTRIEPAGPFYKAEEYHQNYDAKHGRSCGVQP